MITKDASLLRVQSMKQDSFVAQHGIQA